MPPNREAWRNVHFYNASTGEDLGGFHQEGSVTDAILIWSLGSVVLTLQEDWTVKHRESGRIITPSSNPVEPGHYDVDSAVPIRRNDEPWTARVQSHSASSGREDAFREGVRARDGRCVVSGQINSCAQWGRWAGFQAAHVFPLEQESLWIQHNYGRWITNMNGVVGSSGINSVQNGFILSSSLHELFNQYLFSINPDDNYKIIMFVPDDWGIDGRTLDPICRDPNDPNHVSEEVLRWHFRQSVLANMRGGGEPIFETDFPPGTDMMATMRAEPYSKERFEMEIASRLSKLENVSMRGGGPYDFLDEDEDDEDDLISMKIGINQKMAKFNSRDYDDDTPDAQDDHKSIISSTSQASTLKLTRHSDTISHDKNNYLWDTETASSSGVSNPYASTVDTYYKEKRNHSGKNNNNTNGVNKVAPGLIPWAPKEDIYSQPQSATGFIFAKNKPDALPPPPTWTTIDPTTAKVNYEGGAQKAAQTQKYSWDPAHKSNTPLAATFGTPNVVHAPETALTAERLEKLDAHHEKRRKAQSVADYCEVAISPPSSPNIPPSEPSVILSDATRLFDTRSERSSLFVDDDVIMTDANPDIDADVRANFMTDISAMHDVRPALSNFEKRNKDIIATNIGPITYINDFGGGKVKEFTPKYEDRTRSMNENMEYVGPNKGQVKKRIILGFKEMIAAREAEMVRASKEYQEWKAMSPEARMELLSEIRQPIQLWNGKPGAADDDLYSVQDIPKFYKKERLKKLMRRQKLRALLADKAKAKNQKSGSQSARSERTVDTRNTIGRLGDCDDVQTDTSAGSRTPQRSTAEVQNLLVRALKDGQSRGRRLGTSRQSTSRNISPSHSVASTSSTTVETGFALPARLFAGGTGNSVAGPRPTLAKAPSSPGSVQSQSPWSPMRPPSSVACFSNGPRWTPSDSNSTVKGQRNAPLGSTILAPASKSAASQGTNVRVDYDELLAYDDSPLLQKPVDINIDLPALQGDALIQYNLAVENSVKRGRVVTVRLHTLPDGMPKFTPGAVADRVFGGLVQEFQLHPDKRTAVVVFLHSIEARAFVHHFQNVREKGTEQEIRELQIEVSWYKGSEAESILPPQPNLLKHHLALSATRCIQLHRIPLGKTHKEIFAELGQRLDKLLLSMYLITPQQHYLQQSCGRRALIEFRSLSDAIEAYQDLTSGMIQEYEDAEPEFVMEGTAKQSPEKAYCGCLGCEERRRHREMVKERKKRAVEAEFAEASTKASARSESAMEAEAEEDLMEFSSDCDSD